MMAENMKMKLFYGTVGSLSCNIQKEVNEFLSRTDIKVCDVKVSNSDSACVICVFYKLKNILHAQWLDKSGHKICSNCENDALLDPEEYVHKGRRVYIETQFCPYCGAIMDENKTIPAQVENVEK